MKLLFDENISYRIVKKIVEYFPHLKHVLEVSPKLSSDIEIYEYARQNDFVIVTFDEDFVDIQLLKGVPPKLIWLRMGNSSTLNIMHCLLRSRQQIMDFTTNAELGILEIY